MLKELDIIAAKKTVLTQQLKDLEQKEEELLFKVREHCISWVKEKGLLWKDVSSSSKRAHLSDVRVAICVFLRENTHMTLKEIANFIGRLHHTTILHHIEKTKSHRQKSLIQSLSLYVSKR
jgi:chromosomal replication initiation ATPase DnaA